MLVIAFHEFGHAITACCTGGRVKSISLDPHDGGVTHMQGGMSAVTLPAGYLGSSIIGSLLIFAGFDIVASKVASIVLGVCFLLTLWWARRDWLTIITILLAVGLLVACWFIAHGEALKWVVVGSLSFLWLLGCWGGLLTCGIQLFIGVMSALYSVWDIVSLFFVVFGVCVDRGGVLTAFSATTLFSAKSTRPMLASSPRDTEDLPSAGVSSGRSFLSRSLRSRSLLPLLRSVSRSVSRRRIRSISFQLGDRRCSLIYVFF